MTDSSGTGANRAGRRLETAIVDILRGRGYEHIPKHQFFPARILEQPIFTQQYEVGKDIYGKRRRVDVILSHPRLWPDGLVIQCKWQASSGSVEEKYPFEVLSIAMNQFDTILILDGDGYSDGAKHWLQVQAGKNRLLHVFNQGDFARFASHGRI